MGLITYEELINEANEAGVEVIEKSFKGNLKGLYCSNHIFISDSLYKEADKKCILAEELGHHYTSSSNILDLKDIVNLKQELKARNWSYEKLCSIDDLIAAYNNGVKNRYELAKFLNITEECIDDSIKYFSKKYGICTTIGNYCIYFEPNLGIVHIDNEWEIS